MHNLSCENEFYLHENEKWFPYQRVSTYPRFETEARGNAEMAYSQFASHPSSRTFLSFARFGRTRERLCIKWVRSLLSMRDMLLGYSFPPRSNNRTGLSMNGSSRSEKKKTVWRGKTRLTSPDFRAATSSKAWRDANRAWFFPPHSRRQNEALSANSFPGSCPTRSQVLSWRVGEGTWERGWLCSQDVCWLKVFKIFFCDGQLL